MRARRPRPRISWVRLQVAHCGLAGRGPFPHVPTAPIERFAERAVASRPQHSQEIESTRKPLLHARGISRARSFDLEVTPWAPTRLTSCISHPGPEEASGGSTWGQTALARPGAISPPRNRPASLYCTLAAVLVGSCRSVDAVLVPEHGQRRAARRLYDLRLRGERGARRRRRSRTPAWTRARSTTVDKDVALVDVRRVSRGN